MAQCHSGLAGDLEMVMTDIGAAYLCGMHKGLPN
jgi:hypothetical protein